MIASFFRSDQSPEELFAGFLPKRKDRDKLAYKAFILGRQLAALEKERLNFYKEQAQSAQQLNQMLMLIMNLKAQGGLPPMELPAGGASVPPMVPGGGGPMPGVSTGPSGAGGTPPMGPLPEAMAGAGGALPVPGSMPPQMLGGQPV